MTPPAGARDPVEGYCIGCRAWERWHALEACPSCKEPLCADHRRLERHDCKERR